MNFPCVLEAYLPTRHGDIIKTASLIKTQVDADDFISRYKKARLNIRVKNPPFKLEAWLLGDVNKSLLGSKIVYSENSLKKFIESWPTCQIEVVNLTETEKKEFAEWVSKKPSKTLSTLKKIKRFWDWVLRHPYHAGFATFISLFTFLLPLTCKNTTSETKTQSSSQPATKGNKPQLPSDTSKQKHQGASKY